MFKDTKFFLCVEPTSDGDIAFLVDSKETFDRLVQMERDSINEADYWGEMLFDVDPNDKDRFWINEDDVENAEAVGPITAEQVKKELLKLNNKKNNLEMIYRNLMDGE
jgi:hypothetical protein